MSLTSAMSLTLLDLRLSVKRLWREDRSWQWKAVMPLWERSRYLRMTSVAKGEDFSEVEEDEK